MGKSVISGEMGEKKLRRYGRGKENENPVREERKKIIGEKCGRRGGRKLDARRMTKKRKEVEMKRRKGGERERNVRAGS